MFLSTNSHNLRNLFLLIGFFPVIVHIFILLQIPSSFLLELALLILHCWVLDIFPIFLPIFLSFLLGIVTWKQFDPVEACFYAFSCKTRTLLIWGRFCPTAKQQYPSECSTDIHKLGGLSTLTDGKYKLLQALHKPQ